MQAKYFKKRFILISIVEHYSFLNKDRKGYNMFLCNEG